MTRISEAEISRSLLTELQQNRETVQKYSNEVSSGLKVSDPGDSTYSGTISQLRGILQKSEGFSQRIKTVESLLTFQQNALDQANSTLIRAKEIATQAGNETNGSIERSAMSEEVFQLRDHLVSLANSNYQGSYIFAGAANDQPAYSDATYTNGTGGALERFVYTSAGGSSLTKTVSVTDNLSVTVNTPGNQIFDNAIQALERLGRALQGVQTTPASGVPDGGGTAYTFPDDLDLQADDIRDTISLIDTARETDVMPEIVNLAGKLKRLETASSLLDLSKTNSQEVLAKLQEADVIESASNLTRAQTALQASMTVTARVLNLSVLDYL